jgi:hypothetical protein
MERLAGCPRCGQVLVGEPACPRCGVIFAKLKPREAVEAARSIASPAYSPVEVPARAGVPWGLVVGFAALLIAGAVGLPRLRSGMPPAASTPTESSDARATPSGLSAEPPPPPVAPPVAFQTIAIPTANGPADVDAERFAELARRMNGRAPIGAADVQASEDLLARHPDEQRFRGLLAEVLITAGVQERERRRFVQATAYLDRATVVEPADVRPWLVLMQVSQDASDWARAEAAARGALAVEPRRADAWFGLGYALMRQDRNADAAEALRTAAEIRPDPATKALLARVMSDIASEKGMTEQQLSHFHVRYDGEAHEAVGREILRALERHFATLAGSLDHQPTATIPVILFTREGYYTSSGVPAWAGGHFDLLDGRIRVPIGGLGAGLTPDMDNTLIHELTHAFVHDRTRGTAPREIQEGLAQYMAGDRLDAQLNTQQLARLADGQLGGVRGFYLSALSFMEYLVANRGMGGVNDLLEAMGETGSVDEAFRQVHGQTFPAAQQAWRQRLRQQHGS